MLKIGEPPIGVPYVHMDIICLYGRVATPYFIVNTPHGTPAKMCASQGSATVATGCTAWYIPLLGIQKGVSIQFTPKAV